MRLPRNRSANARSWPGPVTILYGEYNRSLVQALPFSCGIARNFAPLDGKVKTVAVSGGSPSALSTTSGAKVPIGFQTFLRWDSLSDPRAFRQHLAARPGPGLHVYAGFEIGVPRLGARDDVPMVVEGSTLDVVALGLVMRQYF